MKMPEEKTHYPTNPAGAYLGISGRWLEKLRVIGGGPIYYKFGRRVLYRKEDLDAWAAARRRRSTSDSGPEASEGVR